jgi:hypothetical protein
MTPDEIIAMARQVGLWPAVTDTFPKELVAFSALVEAHEREECAKVCDEFAKDSDWPTVDNCAAEIRARGTT